MHFSNFALLLILALLFSSVSAQQTPGNNEACKQCLITSRVMQVPACEGIISRPRNNSGNNTMTPKERTCQCGAADSDDWITSCTKPDLCDNLTATVLRSAYGGIKLACIYAGVSSTSDAAGGSSSLLVSRSSVTVGVTVAAATVLGVFL
ncbi:MAG: hypothetical protein JOS17DRAFT_778502 [Linnemannia elongata]|nr:MAG: hypothetical protein JOS17DRAFT_778502 [Linnemannia elongata]